MNRRIFAPVTLAAVLLLTACGGAPASPPAENSPPTAGGQEPAGNEAQNEDGGSSPAAPAAGGVDTATVEVDGSVYVFEDGRYSMCTTIGEMLMVRLDILTWDGEPVEADRGLLEISLPTAEGLGDPDLIPSVSLTLPIPEEGFSDSRVWVAGEADYAEERDVTLTQTDRGVAGTQVLTEVSNDPGPPIEAHIEVVCAG